MDLYSNVIPLSSLLPEKPAEPKGPQIIVNSHHVIATAGSNVTLVCNALNFRHFNGAWLWSFNGNYTILDERLPNPYYSQSVVKFDDRMVMVLDVINASERHSGLYECSVFESVWLEKNSITLIIDEKGNLMACIFGLIPFLSPEAALLLVSTKNRDLWLRPTPEVRDSRTSRHSAHAQSQV